MSNLKRYPEYKDSGVPWLGEIPSHWEEKRMRFFVKTNPLKSELELNDDTLVSFVPMEAVSIDGGLDLESEKELEEVYKGYTYFRNGDVVLAKITPCFENGKASICNDLTNGVGFGTTELHVIRPSENTTSEYVFYLIRSDTFMKVGESEMYGAGGQKRVPESFIKNFVAPLPPLSEQKTIVSFLDSRLNHIDTLISKQEQLLDKLAEQRSAVITYAVTKGLDPKVPMKDSGVEWLGEIPEHWNLTRLKNSIHSAQNGVWGNEAQDDESDVVCFRVADFDRKRFVVSQENLTIRSIHPKDYKNKGLTNGDLLLEKSGGGEKQPVGFVVLNNTNMKSVCSNFVAKVSLKEAMDPRYWAYHHNVLYEARVNTRSIKQSTGIQNLDSALYFNELACFPPYEEQEAIALFLDQETSRIDQVVITTESIIDKLKEYRSALITQAVTGKIDVRNMDKKTKGAA